MGVKIDRFVSLFLAAFPTTSPVLRLSYNKPGGATLLIFAWYVPLASQSPYPIIAL